MLLKDYLGNLKNEKKLSYKEISELSGLPEETVKSVLHGETLDPRISTLTKLLTALGGLPKSDNAERQAEEAVTVALISDICDKRIADMREHIKLLNRDKKILIGIMIALIAFVLGALVVDMSLGTHGRIRY